MKREEAKASGKGTHETHACVCISKQAVLDIVDSYSESRSNVEDVTQDMISDILALPPVIPQPKTGRWVENDRGISICSCCGKDKYEDIDGSIYDDVWFPNYCPNCGAKMVDLPEGSDKG